MLINKSKIKSNESQKMFDNHKQIFDNHEKRTDQIKINQNHLATP